MSIVKTAEIVPIFIAKMGQLGITHRELLRRIQDAHGEAAPCMSTLTRIIRHKLSTEKDNLVCIAEALGIREEELNNLINGQAKFDPNTGIVRKGTLDQRFIEAERHLDSAIKAIKHSKEEIRQLDSSLTKIMSFFSQKFEHLQDLKSSIQSMKIRDNQ